MPRNSIALKHQRRVATKNENSVHTVRPLLDSFHTPLPPPPATLYDRVNLPQTESLLLALKRPQPFGDANILDAGQY
jgi:hypothetical protein